ncbi:MAG: hypothetical protein M0R17_05590 [Candidatus Omnitrophica bacterium]|jgi:hypothetical protein|nr:hypothetical protein [Candidatus Omnitrophota bacterium]
MKKIKQTKEDIEERNKEIEKLLKKGLWSWEDDNTISLDGTNINLIVEDL